MPLFDTHCHLDFPHFDEDRDAVLARMAAADVRHCISVAVDLEALPRLRALAESQHHVWFSVGVHPNHACAEPDVETLCALAAHERCVAIGETGMDFFRHHVPADVQEQRFRTHIRAAIQSELPVIVHMRDADEACVKVMREENVQQCGGVMHCFSSTEAVAQQCLDMGMAIAFSGNVTFKRNDDLRKVAVMVPDHALLIETDAPYLAPVPYRGKRNEPSYVAEVAACIAEVRGISADALASISYDNAMRLFLSAKSVF